MADIARGSLGGTRQAGVPVMLLLATAVVVGAQVTTGTSGWWGGGGLELVAIVVTAGFCQDSQRADYRDAIQEMTERLRLTAVEGGGRLHTVGVSVDQLAPDGLRHLQRLGSFDQVIVGGGWGNLVSTRLLQSGLVEGVTTPQVVILERTVGGEGRSVRVSGDRFLHRVVGVGEILRWAGDGFPLP